MCWVEMYVCIYVWASSVYSHYFFLLLGERVGKELWVYIWENRCARFIDKHDRPVGRSVGWLVGRSLVLRKLNYIMLLARLGFACLLACYFAFKDQGQSR